jgi:TolA-binding protein
VRCYLFFIPILSLACSHWLYTRREGNRIEQKIEYLKRENTRLRKELKKFKRNLEEIKDSTKIRTAELQRGIERATRVLSRNSAEWIIKLDETKKEMRELEGKIEEIKYNLENIQLILKEIQKKRLKDSGSNLPEDPNLLYKEAQKKYSRGELKESRELFQLFIFKFPGHYLAPKVQFRIAETYVKENRTKVAIREFQKVIDNYPKSNEAPRAMFEMASLFFSLGYCDNARVLLKGILTRFPSSPLRNQAKIKLKEIRQRRKRCKR